MSHLRRMLFLTFCMIAVGTPHGSAEEVMLDFEASEVGKPVAAYTEKDVGFQLAYEPKKSKAKGRIMFFPHLGDDHKGILNAMADEAIPLRITLPRPATRVTLVLWGSTTSAALAEAFDRDERLLARDELDQVPVRQSPEEDVPYFRLSLEGSGIVTIDVSGSKPGGFVAVDEIRITYEEPDPSVPQSAP